MRLRTLLAVAAAKAALTACHLSGRPGSSLPGRAALKIDPHIIAPLAADIRRGIIVTCGTNGKTTTNNLLCSMLEAQGYRVVSNRLGANMLDLWGIFSQRDLWGTLSTPNDLWGTLTLTSPAWRSTRPPPHGCCKTCVPTT